MSLTRKLGLLAIIVVLPSASCTMIGVSDVQPPAPEPTEIDLNAERIRENEESSELELIPDPIPVLEEPSRYGNMVQYDEFGITYRVLDTSEGYQESGIASWYGEPFHGRRTSSGETYDMYGMSAAHRTLPLPSYVEVTNRDNGRSVVLRVTDRGPFVDPELRIIDVSYTAALKLGLVGPGTAAVLVEALEPWQVRIR